MTRWLQGEVKRTPLDLFKTVILYHDTKEYRERIKAQLTHLREIQEGTQPRQEDIVEYLQGYKAPYLIEGV